MASSGSSKNNENPEVSILGLKIEHLQDALGIGVAKPRLSWITASTVNNWRQSAYEIEIYLPDGTLLGSTRRVDSSDSVLIPWPFKPLSSRECRLLRVRTWGDDNQSSIWSERVPVETGLLHVGDWTARFITPDWEEDTTRPQPLPLLRREFDVTTGVKQARLYITALGLYEAQINGTIVGDHALAPGWTSYHHRLRYQTYDVTGLLRQGGNAMGAILGAWQ